MTESEVRRGAALIVDIAGTVALRAQLGDKAAGRRIRALLESIIAAVEAHGGGFIKSYGDDVLAVFEQRPIASAATVAVKAQRLAQEAGLQLYAGFHFGEIEFRQTMGHPDALGMTVNIAARLHKLTEGVPGRIFFAEEALASLPAGLRSQASLFGTREIKGMGKLNIWTLRWEQNLTTTLAVVPDQQRPDASMPLLLRHGNARLHLPIYQGSCTVGRGRDCALRVPDPEPRVSSMHLVIERSAERWYVQDISRNGTWMRDAATGEESMLPNCKQVPLPREGQLCLGRPFALDASGQFTIAFRMEELDKDAGVSP